MQRFNSPRRLPPGWSTNRSDRLHQTNLSAPGAASSVAILACSRPEVVNFQRIDELFEWRELGLVDLAFTPRKVRFASRLSGFGRHDARLIENGPFNVDRRLSPHRECHGVRRP